MLLATRVSRALVRRQVTGALVRYQGVRAPSFIVARGGMPRYGRCTGVGSQREQAGLCLAGTPLHPYRLKFEL